MFKKNNQHTGLQLVMDAATAELLKETPGTERYNKIAEQLERLNKIAASRKSEPISKNTLIAAVVNLAGIGLIIRHEQFHTLTTKAIGFVGKLR